LGCSFTPVKLGRTDLRVVPLGVAASYGLPEKEVERAFDRGLNFFYWGSRRTPGFGRALRRMALRGREKVVIVIQSYARSPTAVARSLDKALRELGLDHTDVLLLGWWNLPPPEPILAAASELVQKGRARQLMISCHRRPTFPELARDRRVGLLMMRYNAAHPGAERDVFPHLARRRPAVVAYTATSWRKLLKPARGWDGPVMSAGDCYRFCLSSPHVDVALCGPKDRAQLEANLAALDKGPLAPDEDAWMRHFGQVVHG